ncbi:hypothetical protein HL667_06215 [Bradyrhizobium sp. 83012]|uniref:Uncharacterized protein n=1 Tax=Bradyrhizobium aeschynomenes TaxID=2734909 RepID=A0ABX2C8K9_9BRAD|nr:hypothetical protein [Bradyrhizobium aeschynomenes]NPU64586.1 hypothetical protein [Bradyrhizobium aeschynomenes]
MANGFVFYRGPSMIDGKPIIAVATGTERGSRNGKTGGGLIQTWILREDMSPVAAVNSGEDASICGDCPHRGTVVSGKNTGRSCYVTVFQAPLVVWKAATQKALYPTLSPVEAGKAVDGRAVRLGSYGDPAAVPAEVWKALLANVSAKAGYTHQWRRFPALADYCMASCDSEADHAAAKAQGWRTFRVRLATEALKPHEIVCPASKEAGAKTSCDACKACGGHTAKARVDIAIIAHGAASKVNAYASLRAA